MSASGNTPPPDAGIARDAEMDSTKTREQLTREALADVSAGRTIDHALVQAWAESLDSDFPLPLPR